MTRYAELLKQIAELKAKAEEARQSEVADAVSKINALIAQYGLTAKDLEFDGSQGSKKSAGQKAVGVKYRDGASNSWTGRGRTPKWLTLAEAAGHPRESFLVG